MSLKYPKLKFKNLDSETDKIRPAFTPILYRVESTRFKEIQDSPLVDSDFISQLGG